MAFNGDYRKLAQYLLGFKADDSDQQPKLNDFHDIAKCSNTQVKDEIEQLLSKLKAYHDPKLTIFRHYQRTAEIITDARHERAEFFEHHHIYDKDIAILLREFCVLTIAFLAKLEKLHKKNILCGGVSPYSFMYNRKRKQCEPCDLSVVLSDKSQIKAEKQEHGDLIYIHINIDLVAYNKYLAPELKESALVYTMKKRLKGLMYAAEDRGIILAGVKDVNQLLIDFHQKEIKYSNKAEIYSAGYCINEILSHMLEKIAHYNIGVNEPIPGEVPEEYIENANALLPDKFDNHGNERIIDLLNLAVSYIHDMMSDHVENRDSLAESIAKFKSILKRISMIEPDSMLEREESEEEIEADLELAENEEYEADEEFEAEEAEEEAEEDENHVHDEHGHDKHGHDDTAHDEHGHYEHDHILHDHSEHHDAHAEHEHAAHETHEHEGHDQHEAHEQHEHDEHAAHEEHEHDEHAAHEEHEHEEHAGHEEHEHEEHAAHEEHEHEEHEHEEHEHEEHEHEEHEHEEHEEHEHEEHVVHEEHEHKEHAAHEEHAHKEHAAHEGHAHKEHVAHDKHESHEEHSQPHAALRPGHGPGGMHH